MLLTYWTALAFVSRRAALLAGLMMATSILLGVEARLAKTDAMLLLTAVAAMGAMARIYLGERRPAPGLAGWALPAIFWTALAAGILIKGPLIVMFVGLAVAALAVVDRSVRWLAALRPIPGVLWLCVLVLPWFLAIVSRSGSSFFAESVGHDLMSKVVSAQEAHGAPPGYYFALFWVTFWPGATLAAMAAPEHLGGAPREGREIPAVLDRAGLDRAGTGDHQAAALRAAALSGDRDPDRGRGRFRKCWRGSRWLTRGAGVVLLPAGDPRRRHDRHAGRCSAGSSACRPGRSPRRR